jgi:prenyltransferase beta subunit
MEDLFQKSDISYTRIVFDNTGRKAFMRERWLIIMLIALALLSSAVPGAAKEEGEAQNVIDLQRTGDLVERWGTRPSFPESVTFAYYHVYMTRALGLDISPESRKLIIGYIARCQQPNGGFTASPVYAKTGNVIYTYYALGTLELLGETKEINSEAATDFLLSRIQPNGGITATAREGERASLATTYYGIESLRLLYAADSLDKEKTRAFVQRYREKGQGFMRVQGGASTPQSTYMGVRALKILGTLASEAKREIVDYLKDTRYAGQIKHLEYKLLPDIKAMSATLDTFAALSALQEIDSNKVYEFISSLYVPDNGGFGPRPGLGTTPPSTYHAIASLVRLGKLPDPVVQGQSKRSDVSM